MEKTRENNRREILKAGAVAGFLGSILSFKPMKMFASTAKRSTDEKIIVTVHPDAVQRNRKGKANG